MPFFGQFPTSGEIHNPIAGTAAGALRVEKAATNLAKNPSVEGTTAYWSAPFNAANTLARDNTAGYQGAASAKFSRTGAYGDTRCGRYNDNTSFTAGTTYSVSASVLHLDGTLGALRITPTGAGGTLTLVSQTLTDGLAATGWQRISSVFTMTGTGAVNFELISAGSAIGAVNIDAFQVEAGAPASSYTDGTLGPGYAWTGTAHDSTSTRATGTVVADKPVISLGSRVSPLAFALDVRTFGIETTGIADITAPLQVAITAAKAQSRPLYFPAGVYRFSSQLNIVGLHVRGDGAGYSKLLCTTQLGTGVPAIIAGGGTATGDRHSGSLRDIQVLGPGPNPITLGTKTANCDGIRVDLNYLMDGVRVSFFDSGIVHNSNNGHCTYHNCRSTSNYYGFYGLVDQGDNYVDDCDFGGNAFASMAWPGIVVVDGLVVMRTHLGYGPYGLYQEAGGSVGGTWLLGCTLLHARFEGTGNGALYSENFASGGQVQQCRFDAVGHSWQPANKIAARTADYAVVVGAGTHNYYNSRGYGFVGGPLGTWRFGAAPNWEMHMVGEAVQIMQVDSGTPTNLKVYPTTSDVVGSGTISSGTTSVVVSTAYCGPLESLQPTVTPTGVGGLAGAFTLYITGLASTTASGGSTSFTVNVAGGTPSSNLTFNWRLR